MTSRPARALTGALFVAIAAGPAGLAAQRPQPPLGGAPPRDGTVHGTMVFRHHSLDSVGAIRRAVTGTARWRLEVDSVDWRPKVTLRLALAGPERAEYVIRLADTAPPRRAIAIKNPPLSHIDPRYFTAALAVHELGESRVYHDWSVGDSTFFAPVPSLGPATVLRGTIALLGFHNQATGGSPDAPQSLPRTSRYANLTFAAVFDPRPAPVPVMTPAIQRRMLQRALMEFGVAWVEARVDPRPADSTANSAWARAALTREWGAAAIIELVSATPTTFFVRMRGRYAPVTCTITHDSSRPSCTGGTPWWWPF